MSEYSIQAVSKLTGIGIHTLRTWEKRYQCVVPKRKPNGRRVYGEGEIRKLHLLNDICSLGESIGSIASKSVEELEQLLARLGGEVSKVRTPSTLNLDDIRTQMQGLLFALESYRLDIISHELHKLRIALSTKDFALQIVAPLLREVGSRVMGGSMSIAQEHAVSSIIRFQIGQTLFQSYGRKYCCNTKLGFATPEGEYHEFGILLSALLAAHYDIPHYFLGANMPAQSYVEAAQGLDIDILIVGTSHFTNMNRDGFLDSYLDELLRKIGPKQTVWVGGEAEFNLARFQRRDQFHFIATIQHLESYFKEIE